MSDRVIEVLSGVSAFSGEGFVTLRWGKQGAQMTPDEARAFGLHVLSCAEASEHDAAMLKALYGIGVSETAGAHLLAEMRSLRGA